MSDSICVLFSSMQPPFAAAEGLSLVGSLSHSCCLSTESCVFSASEELLCTFTGAEPTDNNLVIMKPPQSILHILDCGLSMVPVLCHMVTIHHVLDAQLGFFEGNHLARQKV